jgi:hypothetical protein
MTLHRKPQYSPDVQYDAAPWGTAKRTVLMNVPELARENEKKNRAKYGVLSYPYPYYDFMSHTCMHGYIPKPRRAGGGA